MIQIEHKKEGVNWMMIERMHDFVTGSEAKEGMLLDYLLEMESRGLTLITLEVPAKSFDEATNEWTWDETIIRDWRTGAVLGKYTPEEFQELSYAEHRWFDAEHYFD